MTTREVEVWLFRPKNDGRINAAENIIRSECHTRGWNLQLRWLQERRGMGGRVRSLINSEDAVNLYKAIHRRRVGVWHTGEALAPIVPWPESPRHYIGLRDFVRHKAFCRNLFADPIHKQWLAALSEFESWFSGIWCENEGDPRCLPFHVFKTSFSTDRLASRQGRIAFANGHGPQSSRADDNGLRWNRPQGQYHGREVVQIAGRDLVRGFHWDVENLGGDQTLSSVSEVWVISKGGYVNVYPDEHIRKGKRSRPIRLKERKPTETAGFFLK